MDPDFGDKIRRLTDVIENSIIEVEARIRGPVINDISINRLMSSNLCAWAETVYVERRRISKTNRRCTYRHRRDINTGEVSIVCKSSLISTEIPDAWCTVHVSTEVSMPSMFQTLVFIKEATVKRLRGTLAGHWIDITDDGDAVRLEVEAQDVTRFSLKEMIDVVSEVCRVMQNSLVFVGRLDWMAMKHLMSTHYGEFCIEKKAYQKPITMNISDLYRVLDSNSWLVTPKVDGVRRFIATMENIAFSVDLTGNIRYMCEIEGDRQLGTTILDCEYHEATSVYHVIDVIIYEGKYIGNAAMEHREDIMGDVCLVCSSEFSVLPKPYERVESFKQLMNVYNSWLESYDIDGMIFVNRERPYMQPALKWKAASTVDLEVIIDEIEDVLRVLTCDQWYIDMPIMNTGVLSAGIWEFKDTGGALVPVRSRPDKPQANSLYIVEKNISGSVPGTIFTGIGCYLMRKYHNVVKRYMLKSSNIKGATILDIGTGQGGDVPKWRTARKVYCIEPDIESIREMQGRIAHLERHGVLDTVLVKNSMLRDVSPDDIPEKISMFTAFFCMNQWYDGDWEALETIVKARGARGCKLLAIALTDPYENKDDCWTLSTLEDGTKYCISLHQTRIVNIRETVINTKRLDDIMNRCGMERSYYQRLNESDVMTEKEKRLSSMYTALIYSKKPGGIRSF